MPSACYPDQVMFGEDAVDSDEESLLAEAREITKSLSHVDKITLSAWFFGVVCHG